MRNQPIEPQFDDRFWAAVNQRVERVRELTSEELVRAQTELLTVEAEAEVVPVFPLPFWARVNKRAAKVRRMALDELADAEDRLVNREAADGLPAGERVAGPAFRRRLHLPPTALALRARVGALGFVAAVLAALFFLPQVVPISSLAEVRQRGPLALFFSGDGAADSGRSRTSDGVAKAGDPAASEQIRTDIPKESTAAAGKASSQQSARGMSGGTGGPGGGTSGAKGSSPSPSAGASAQGAAGSSGTASEGSSFAGATAEDGASAGSAPEAPSNLLVTAVDDSTVRLRWRDNSDDETGFVIERKGQTAVGIETTEANSKSYLWTGLSAGVEYCFRVRARNDAGSSDWFPEQYRCVTTHQPHTGSGPVSLSSLPCSSERSLSAGASSQETQIVFRNQTGQTVWIYALGRTGVREPSPITLGPNQQTAVSTFLEHPYVVTGADPAASCLAIFTGESWSSVATITAPGG